MMAFYAICATFDRDKQQISVAPEELDEEFHATLMTLGFFSSRPQAEAILTEPATDQPSLEATAEAMRQVFPAAVAQYAHMGRSIARVLAEYDADAPEPTHEAKVARNDPCPCVDVFRSSFSYINM